MSEHLPDTNVGNIEYIRKQDAVDAFEDTTFTKNEIRRRLLDIKPADVVQVVRCDNCKYYGSRRWCELHSSVFDDNAFCSYGEKRG